MCDLHYNPIVAATVEYTSMNSHTLRGYAPQCSPFALVKQLAPWGFSLDYIASGAVGIPLNNRYHLVLIVA